MEGGAEVLLKYRAVKLDIQRCKHLVPADLLQFREGQRPLLDLPPELVVLPVEHIVHPRLVGPQAEVGKALLHGLADIGVKVQQGVVDVDEDQFHRRLPSFFSRSAYHIGGGDAMHR